MDKEKLQSLRGLVATVVTTGSVKTQFSQCFADLRSYNDRQGWHAVEYKQFPASLVESGRDAVVEHALAQNYDWILHIDADAAPFSPDSLERMITNAYVHYPNFQAIGAYCQLKGSLNVPTIDTGTGKWEEHYPGEGVIPVIRTGAHFLFTKCEIFRKIGALGLGQEFLFTPVEGLWKWIILQELVLMVKTLLLTT